MKFGGSSVADAGRIRAIAGIVRQRLERKPVIVVSALGGVTDLLERAISLARGGDLERLEPVLADLERRHRWALTGCVETAALRHAMSLEMDGLFDDLRQRLRSVRILGEGTPRATDGLLAFGELLSARIVAAAFGELGLAAHWVDPRKVMVTDGRFGRAAPQLDAVRSRCEETLLPLVERGELPVLGGFVGATAGGETTTLGRGGSDTSAAVLGLALDAEEIQLWTDVAGLMTADPDLVPEARTLPRISFAEAAELAFYGARVLHPASLAPAVQREIPVRVLSSMQPAAPGTWIGQTPDADAAPIASVASRSPVRAVRIASRSLEVDPGFLRRTMQRLEGLEAPPDLVVSSDLAVTLVLPESAGLRGIEGRFGSEARVELLEPGAIICMVGAGLRGVRGKVLAALAEWDPEVLALGVSRNSVTALVREELLQPALQSLHRRFFERSAVS